MFLQEKFSGAEVQVILQRVSVLQHQLLSRNKKYLISCLLTVELIRDLTGESHCLRSCADFGRAEAHLLSVQNSFFHMTAVWKEES